MIYKDFVKISFALCCRIAGTMKEGQGSRPSLTELAAQKVVNLNEFIQRQKGLKPNREQREPRLKPELISEKVTDINKVRKAPVREKEEDKLARKSDRVEDVVQWLDKMRQGFESQGQNFDDYLPISVGDVIFVYNKKARINGERNFFRRWLTANAVNEKHKSMQASLDMYPKSEEIKEIEKPNNTPTLAPPESK